MNISLTVQDKAGLFKLILLYAPKYPWATLGVLTDLFGDLSDSITGQIENQEVLKTGDEVWDFLQSSSVDLPLLDLTELDQTAWQHLKGRVERGISCKDLRGSPPVRRALPSTLPVRFGGLGVHLLSAASL